MDKNILHKLYEPIRSEDILTFSISVILTVQLLSIIYRPDLLVGWNGLSCAMILVLLSLVLLLRKLRTLAKLKIWTVIFVALPGSFFGCWSFYRSYNQRLASPFLEELIASKLIHIDSLMHWSISNMISNYDVKSTGVAGLSEITYYTLTHRLFGYFSSIMHIPVSHVFNFIFPIIFPGILIGSCLLFIKQLANLIYPDTSPRTITFWIIPLFLIGYPPLNMAKNLGLWYHNEISGESQSLSFIVLFVLCSLLLLFEGDLKIRFRRLMQLVIVIAGLFLLLNIKLSTAAIFLVIIGSYLIFYLSRFNLRKILFLSLLSAIFVIGFYFFILAEKNNPINLVKYLHLHPLHFVNTYIPSSAVWYFYPIQLLPTVVNIFLLAKLKPNRYLNSIFFAASITVVCFIPASLFVIEGAGAVYFIDFQRYLNLAVMAILLSSSEFLRLVSVQKRAFKVSLALASMFCVMQMSRNMIANRESFDDVSQAIHDQASIARIDFIGKIQESLKKFPHNEPVVIPADWDEFWSFYDNRSMPFLVPALFGRVTANGVVCKNGTLFLGNGLPLERYGKTSDYYYCYDDLLKKCAPSEHDQ